MTSEFVAAEWAAVVRNELLDARVQLEHLPPAARQEHYRDVIDRAVTTLRQSDQRADKRVYLEALKEMFPPWLGSGAVVQEPPPPLEPEDHVQALIQAAPNLEENRKIEFAEKLSRAFKITPPEGVAAAEVRRELGLPPGQKLDPEMVQFLLVAIIQLLNDIVSKAGAAWKDLEPASRRTMDAISGGISHVGRCVSIEWKENLKALRRDVTNNSDLVRRKSVSFEQALEDMDKTLQSESPDPACLVASLRGIIELQLFPNPTTVLAMLMGGLQRTPIEFAQNNFKLVDLRTIKRDVDANVKGADEKHYWKQLERVVNNLSESGLQDKVRKEIVSATRNSDYCPEVLK